MTVGDMLNSLEPFGDTAFKITKYDTEKNQVVTVDPSEKLTTLMGVDIEYSYTDYKIGYFIFEELLDGTGSTSADINTGYGDSEEIPDTGEKLNLLPIAIVLAAGALMIVFGRKLKKA